MTVKRRKKFNILPNFEACSVALSAACAIGAAVGAHAQTPASGRSRVGDTAFARADSNQDGRLSREEARLLPAISERFDEIDVNHDQFLSRAEFDEALKQ